MDYLPEWRYHPDKANERERTVSLKIRSSQSTLTKQISAAHQLITCNDFTGATAVGWNFHFDLMKVIWPMGHAAASPSIVTFVKYQYSIVIIRSQFVISVAQFSLNYFLNLPQTYIQNLIPLQSDYIDHRLPCLMKLLTIIPSLQKQKNWERKRRGEKEKNHHKKLLITIL